MTSLIIVSLLAVAVLYLGLFKYKTALLPVSVTGLLAAAAMALLDWNQEKMYFSEMMLFDNYAVAFSVLLILTTLLIFGLSRNYFEKISGNVAEYYAMLLFALAGGIVMVSFYNMAMLFIGIEILSVSLYVLAGIRRNDPSSNEASLKYFLMGSFATGFLLFGIALIYGATGSFNLAAIAASDALESGLFRCGVLLMLVGLSFKVSAAPFHFWTPDVYQGSPGLVAMFMATVVKTAGFAAFLRLFSIAFPDISGFWSVTVAVLCILTLFSGNISAVFQQNFKRLLAWSSVSHAGYLLLAILAVGLSASSAVLVYTIAYSLASVAAFGIMILVSRERGSDHLDSFNGLSKSNPFLAFTLTLAVCSLAGIPLTAGFFGKFYVFKVALEQGYTWLVIIAVINAMIGIYYYFKVVIAMYMKENAAAAAISVQPGQRWVLSVVVILLFLFGIFPGLITDIL
ncbi:NADH dehydrogenase subunit N [Anseongella ginsenosidimutans]|uniref:NADH-quinone oxidoreductase subunit N n=1 Tax=Anseongella ginsenosidimutans TaxID=496056 RepID=A0A4R3KV77_9SPHI|nr:NADH-quinone oxidoreductase subunit N [Anseongella ginsenosidimutans]QEC51699.1 NADH-quinone oxidoreductase subunit N [Anseongella ginsenosidimutans]TCS89058.1 NADH dehydrogenase subunit N [Anseongella ginsenosidimutans]